MAREPFSHTIISDSIHGSIGISKLEQEIVNSRDFQRLKRIKQLGLASYVFPGAEHTRFAHSIGVLHVMYRMTQALKAAGCPYVKAPEQIQQLRIAALLHDIGHYPLAHLGEKVFERIDAEDRAVDVAELENHHGFGFLQDAATSEKSEAVSHERLGEVILTNPSSDINRILIEYGYDQGEVAKIAKIFNGESEEYDFHTQLMSSTLDCDRVDYLIRDSALAGTKYGNVDLDYILRNICWDGAENYVCYHRKAITAIEHLITGRYFSYNVTFHKTTMGFELLAQCLFYEMIRDKSFKAKIGRGSSETIIRSFEEIKTKILTDPSFLSNFNDEYFWHYLEHWHPKEPVLEDMKNALLCRTPLRLIHEIRELHRSNDGESNPDYRYMTSNKFADDRLADVLFLNGCDFNHIAVLSRKSDFESLTYSVGYAQNVEETDRLKLVKIQDGNSSKDLMSIPSTILHALSDCQPRFARLYAFVEKDSVVESELKKFAIENISRDN